MPWARPQDGEEPGGLRLGGSAQPLERGQGELLDGGGRLHGRRPGVSGPRRSGRRGSGSRYARLASSSRSPSASMRRRKSSPSSRPGPEVGHDVLELALVVEVAEDHVDLADDQLEHVELGLEQVEQRRLDRPGGDQVEDVDVVGLADPAEPADALLDPHRVPGQVEVADGVGELEVSPLAAGLGGEQERPAREPRTAASFAQARGRRGRPPRIAGRRAGAGGAPGWRGTG